MRTASMTKYISAAVAVAIFAACGAAGDGLASQAIAGPGGVSAVQRAAGEIAISWTADPAAARYQVYQGAAGGELALIASVFDSAGGAPSTSYIAEVLAGGEYCYAVASTYADGSTSELSPAACTSATSGGGCVPAALSYSVNQPAHAYRVLVGSTPIGHPVAFANGASLIYPLDLPVGFVVSKLSISYNRGPATSSQFIKLALDVDNLDSPSGGVATAFTTTSLITDTASTGDQQRSTMNLAVDAAGFPTGGAGALTIRGDRAYALRVVGQPDGVGVFPLFYGTKVNAR